MQENKLNTNSIFFTKHWKKLLILLVLVVLGYFGWQRYQKNGQEYEQHQAQNRSLTQTLELSGEIDAKRKENLHFQAGGLVTYYPHQEGDKLEKFETIASLDQRQLKKTLKKRLNLYAKELNDFSQTRDDHEEAIEANDIDLELKRILENAQYDLDNAVIDVELQDLSIKLSRIYAPFAGILTSSPITSPNVNVLATDTFTIVDPFSLYFKADLDESDLSKVKENMPATITLDAYSDLKLDSTVTNISYAAKETTTGTTYEIEFSLPKSDLENLRLGLNGTSTIILSEKQSTLTVPLETVFEDEKSTFVYLKKGSEIIKQPVETGISNNTYIEITFGLSPGDTVLFGENLDKLVD